MGIVYYDNLVVLVIDSHQYYYAFDRRSIKGDWSDRLLVTDHESINDHQLLIKIKKYFNKRILKLEIQQNLKIK